MKINYKTEKQIHIAYICDKNKCEKCKDTWLLGECHHTTDVAYALNFDEEPIDIENNPHFELVGEDEFDKYYMEKEV